jgi:hypothetical protein
LLIGERIKHQHSLTSVFNLAEIENQTTNTKPPLRWLLKLSRIAFICNIFFLLAFSIQLSDWVKDEELVSTIVIMGYVMGFTLNPVTNVCYLLLAIFGPKKLSAIPSWLIVANVLFLVIDAFYILYLNAQS